MLGALTSINARNTFLFGTTGDPSRPQLLYWTDFDDPRRGQAGADPEDFNGFRDNALTREGLTGPGDSGSPLIIDQAFSRPVVIGVLSGGSTFFAGQPGGSYGTQSFYQPLFLYWEWIVANNPYRYVTANAGNRNWEDRDDLGDDARSDLSDPVRRPTRQRPADRARRRSYSRKRRNSASSASRPRAAARTRPPTSARTSPPARRATMCRTRRPAPATSPPRRRSRWLARRALSPAAAR